MTNCAVSMKKEVLMALIRWGVANAILPIVVPILVLAGGDWLFADNINLSQSLKKLIYEGFYIFSAMTLVFSLFEDYSAFQHSIKPVAGMILMLPMMATCIIFYATEKNNGVDYFSNHLMQFFCMWGILALYATFIKYKILKFKLKYQY